MAALSISCPKCQATLKIPSRKLLGKKAKCRKCEHRFVLEEPDEVELKLATTVAVTTEPNPEKPEIPLGLNPVWVPDAESPVAPVSSVPTAVDLPTETVLPPTGIQTPSAQADPFDFASTSAANHLGPLDLPSGSVAGTSSDDSASSANATAGKRRRRGRRGTKGTVIMSVGSALFVACMGGFLWLQNQSPPKPNNQKKIPVVNQAWEDQKKQMEADNIATMDLSPTSGEPIPIEYMPFTPQMICHLRPAELWASDSLHREFIATCGHLGIWLTNSISEITRFEPQEIEELTFAINFGSRTTAPQVAAVVRLVSEQRPSDLQLNRFKGQVRPDLDVTVYESENYSYMPINNKLFVVAPVTMSDSLAESKDIGEPPMVDIAKLLTQTDRNRQMTIAFDLVNIDTHREYIFGDNMQEFADQFVLWFGKEVKTIAFSLHLRRQELYLETLLSPSAGTTPVTVEKAMKARMKELPETLVKTTRVMTPSVTGYRQMIGRFPAMMRATFLGTTTSVDSGLTRMVSFLPSKAAGNLAAASMYTWNQSTVTDFTQQTTSIVANEGNSLPETIAGRLKIPILVDFNRMPLQEVFAYVADEIKTDININGDALKLSGMTNNMPQTFNLGEVPAIMAIDAMVSNPEYKGLLVIVVDEATKRIEVTTRPVATAAGLTIFNTKQ